MISDSKHAGHAWQPAGQKGGPVTQIQPLKGSGTHCYDMLFLPGGNVRLQTSCSTVC